MDMDEEEKAIYADASKDRSTSSAFSRSKSLLTLSSDLSAKFCGVLCGIESTRAIAVLRLISLVSGDTPVKKKAKRSKKSTKSSKKESYGSLSLFVDLPLDIISEVIPFLRCPPFARLKRCCCAALHSSSSTGCVGVLTTFEDVSLVAQFGAEGNLDCFATASLPPASDWDDGAISRCSSLRKGVLCGSNSLFSLVRI